MKKWIQVLLVAAMMLVVPGTAHEAHAFTVASVDVPQISIQLDGYPLPTAPSPIEDNGVVMMPFRSVATALGLQVEWEAKTNTVVATGDGTELRFRVGESSALLNGQRLKLDAAPIALEDRTFVPLSFFSTAIGARVDWVPDTRIVMITSQPRHLHSMVFYGLGSYDKRRDLPRFDEATFAWSSLDAKSRLVFKQNEYSWPDGGDELLGAVQAAGVDASLMVYSVDQNGELRSLIASPALTEQFANDLLVKLNAAGMSSATLDFETLGDPKAAADVATVRAQYVTFVRTVAKKLHDGGKKLNVVMAPLNGWYQGYDYPGIAASADLLYIMAYSYVDDKLPQPLSKIDEAITDAVQVVDPSKLELGINVYSETKDTIQQKIGLAKRYNLHGVGFWLLKLFDDDFLQSVNDSLHLKPETLHTLP